MGESAVSFGQRVELARRHFFREGKRPDGLVPEMVIRSWERSRELGLGTGDRRVFNPVARYEKSLIEERSRPLIASALPEMEKLHLSLGHAGWALACIDMEGIVVSAVCGSGIEARDLANIFQVGRNVSEAAVGTNGPGCSLTEGRPMVVRAAEHFLDEVRPFSCAAVPLFGPSGALVGVLDATRMGHGEPVTILEPLGIAARAIENRMLEALQGALTMGFHYRPDLLDTPLEGGMVFAEDGTLLGANQSARQLLGLGGGSGVERFETLFDCPPETFRRALAGRLDKGVVRSDGGLRFDARFQAARPGAMLARLREGVQRIHALAERRALPAEAGSGAGRSEAAGFDPVAGQALHVARRAFERDIPVLINGETGTGKEVLARRLHDESSRSAGPFVAINCSSLPAGLIESEFFGYEDGAFTGGRRGGAPGKFELARGGTLFLDEIGDMPMELQGRLLRVLQERSFNRLGGARQIVFDARVVAATHRRLETLVAEGRFREDLYYRIKGVRVSLPALRERGDRAALIEALLAREAGDEGVPALSVEARHVLMTYRWPGNIRQLGHVLRLALTLAEGEEEIGLQHLPEELLADFDDAVAQQAAPLRGNEVCLRDIELEAVRAAMARNGGNVSATARSLGVARATLYRKLKLLGLA
ncbi:sigma-54-dependent Fis family transcriptional regulator [Zoogloea sp.]|uniref:sigma-54-dependent Fis family transcriptional regulator n=1 Tax=Zoogloea sp. TaxID=49181 RepID=UPI0014168A34|nr:MAG: sigma-54-dependent Fis family transcriptional regulator [Zoogloea sp.]